MLFNRDEQICHGFFEASPEIDYQVDEKPDHFFDPLPHRAKWPALVVCLVVHSGHTRLFDIRDIRITGWSGKHIIEWRES
jgi:hypothetical protein